MMTESTSSITWPQRVFGWLVHLFTASGAVFGLAAVYALHQEKFILAFWFMGFAILVDSADGVLARLAQVEVTAPQIDGALMDNLLDYFNYVMVPAFFLLVSDLLPANYWAFVGAGAIVLASAFQFSQTQAKTEDHFFTGFPSYWNIVVFYLFLWQLSPGVNLAIIILLAIMVFVPIKYAYPSRPDYLFRSHWPRVAFVLASILWGVAAAGLLWLYPVTSRFWIAYSVGYCVFYALFGIYRTLVPLKL
ncbi:MAG: CDP-alcohol phosphatidyltransferase family protein [Anaerolineae bacterium]|nr:CDP-alcohol phosphatidyltransferase family protein [Anaerolineae bacterium]